MTLLLGAPATTVVTGLQPNKASVSGHPGHTSLSQAPPSEDTSRLRGTENEWIDCSDPCRLVSPKARFLVSAQLDAIFGLQAALSIENGHGPGRCMDWSRRRSQAAVPRLAARWKPREVWLRGSWRACRAPERQGGR